MKKRFLPTVVSLVAFLILFAYVNLYEVEDIPEPGNDPTVEIAKFEIGDVKSIAWGPNGSLLKVDAVEDTGAGKFKIVKPKVFRADSGEVEAILRNFQNLESKGITIKNATDTAPYGLGTDSKVLVLETATKTVTLTLGGNSPVGGMVYMQRNDDSAIYLVSSVVSAAFRKEPDNLRSKAIFFENFSKIASVTVESASGTFSFGQGEFASWKMTLPKEMEADGGEVSSTIFGVRDLKISKFVNDSPKETDSYGFDKPTFRVLLADASGTRYDLIGGKEENEMVFVKREDEPNVYSVGKNTLSFLQKDVERYRTKDLPKFPREKVEKVVLSTASLSYQIKLNGEKWEFEGSEVKKEAVEGLFDAYHGDRVSKFLKLESKKDENLHEIAMNDRFEMWAGEEKRVVAFGKGDGSSISIFVEGMDEVYKVPMNLYNKFKELKTGVEKVIQDKKGPPVPPNKGLATMTKSTGTTPLNMATAAIKIFPKDLRPVASSTKSSLELKATGSVEISPNGLIPNEIEVSPQGEVGEEKGGVVFNGIKESLLGKPIDVIPTTGLKEEKQPEIKIPDKN